MLFGEVLDQHRYVLDAFAKRRQVDRDHVQAIEQIVLESTLVHELTEVAIGRRDHANLHTLRPLRAERLDFAFLQHAQQFGLQSDAIVPISSRKMEPRFASENLPFFGLVASVKAPLTWPKSSDSSRVSGMAGQLILMKGMLRCALQWCTARAASSLPVPVSPVMSTVLRVADTSTM